MLCCPVAHYSPLLGPSSAPTCILHSVCLHSALHTLGASAFCQHFPPPPLCLDCLASFCLSLALLRPSLPLAAGRSRLRPRHPTRSFNRPAQSSLVVPSIDFVFPHRQDLPPSRLIRPNNFALSIQNQPWAYIDSAGWLLSVRSAKGYTFHTNQPLNLLLLLLPASPTICPPLSLHCAHAYDICQPTLCPQRSFPHTLLALPTSPALPSHSLPLSQNNCTDRRLSPLSNIFLPPALHLTPTHLFATSLQFFSWPCILASYIYLLCLVLPRLASPVHYLATLSRLGKQADHGEASAHHPYQACPVRRE